MGWACLPSDILQRLSCDRLLLRSVCRRWAHACSGHIGFVQLPPSAAAVDILNRRVSQSDLGRLSVFTALQKLEASGLSGTRDCLMLLPALAQLQSLTLGLVTVADGGLQRLAIFTSLAELRIPIACSSLVVDILPGLLRDLPQLQRLGLACANHCHTHHDPGMGLLACELARGNLPCLEITGSMGLSQGDVHALVCLGLTELRAQLCSAAALFALTALTTLRSLTVADWTPGPTGSSGAVLSLAQFSRLTGLMQLHVVHTFGVYNVVELDGLASLTQLQQLELCIPASLEALQHLHRLSCLSAQVALSLPFCDNLDYEQLSCVTRIKFQEMLPVVIEGEIDPSDQHTICLDSFRALNALASLSFVRGAPQICGLGMNALSAFKHLTSLVFHDEDPAHNGRVWPAHLPHLWSEGLSRLTSLRELSIKGCSNLEQLDLSGLTLLSQLSVEGCARLALRGLSSQANLYSLNLRHCRQRLQPLLGDLADLEQLRVLALQGCQVHDAGVAGLLRLTTLKQLDFRDTGVTRAGLQQLRLLPYLTFLDHST